MKSAREVSLLGSCFKLNVKVWIFTTVGKTKKTSLGRKTHVCHFGSVYFMGQ